jgi:hypothetical protein
MTIYQKICRDCQLIKQLECFSVERRSKDGLQTRCKSCAKQKYAAWKKNLSPEKVLEKSRRDRARQIEKHGLAELNAKHKSYNYKNRYKNGPLDKSPEAREKRAANSRAYLKRNPNARIAANLRCRLSQAISGKGKIVSAVKDLGCSWEEFRAHIEYKFTEGMSWENYGKWHIDHIFPLSKIDFSNEIEAKSAVHYTNLQPLWAKDNSAKSNKI